MKGFPYRTLLYYKYVAIEDPELFQDEHLAFCKTLGIKGRIIVAPEGLNGTVSGTKEQCDQYMKAIKRDHRFSDMAFKVDEVEDISFNKIFVRYKKEIVHSSLGDVDPVKQTGEHVSPSKLKEMMQEEDVVLVDMRSNYEHRVGKFKGAITLDMDNFRDLPDHVHELDDFKDKKVVTYCTGGIKCEKASAYLLHRGFKNVFQLDGGIVKYAKEVGGENFDGRLYVFDKRVVVDVNKVNPTEISKCYNCGVKSSRMINCANPECNVHVPQCEECGWKMDGCCSDACHEHPRRRVYDGTGYYAKGEQEYIYDQH